MPYPADTGSRLTLSHRLEYAYQQGASNWVVVMAKEKPSRDAMLQLERVCERPLVLSRSEYCSKGLPKRIMAGMPYAVASRCSDYARGKIASLLQSTPLSAIIVEYPQMLPNLPQDYIGDVPIILEQHNIEWEVSRSLANASTMSGPMRCVRLWESWRLKRFEYAMQDKYSIRLMTFVTKRDADNYPLFETTKKILAQPGATDYSNPVSNRVPRRICFIANMTYAPNIEGALWLTKRVFPIVRDRYPDAQLFLVGKDPTQEIIDLETDFNGVFVTGRVDDLTPFYSTANVIALPVFSGGGINMKSLEAAMCNRPIVATPFAMKGVGLIEGEHYLGASTPHSFASAIVSLLDDDALGRRIASSCHTYASSRYSWDAVCSNWYDSIRECAAE